MAEEEQVLAHLRETLKSATESIDLVRRATGGVVPVVSTVDRAARDAIEVLDAHARLDEALSQAFARVVEARAHLALAQPALEAFVKLRAAGRQAAIDLVAERRAEGGEKPS